MAPHCDRSSIPSYALVLVSWQIAACAASSLCEAEAATQELSSLLQTKATPIVDSSQESAIVPSSILERGSEALADYRFRYKPFLGELPMFVNEHDRHLWEARHKYVFDYDSACARHLAAIGLEKGNHEVIFCNTEAEDGYFNDTLIARKDMAAPMGECANKIFSKWSPEPQGTASADLLAAYSSSFQHFLDGPALRIAQNEAVYHKYNATLLANIAENPTGLNYPIVSLMISKAGFGDRIVGHCDPWNTKSPCESKLPATVTLGCSQPPFVPELARRFRQMMGVTESLQLTKGLLVLAPHTSKGTLNPGRQFVNMKEVEEVVSAKAKKFGLEYHLMTEALETVEDATAFWGRTALLVGAHGGALYNSWFMPAKAGIIEMVGDDGEAETYFWPHTIRFHQHYAPLWPRMATSGPHQRDPVTHKLVLSWGSADMIVNTTELSELMEKMFDRIKAN